MYRIYSNWGNRCQDQILREVPQISKYRQYVRDGNRIRQLIIVSDV